MLDLGAHAEFYPTVRYAASQRMVTTTVDSLVDKLKLKQFPNLLVIDTQGADLKVLKGARKILSFIDGVFVEISEEPLYKGGCVHEEITEFLRQFGLRMRWMQLNSNGHGDAFYCRARVTAEIPTERKNLALGKKAMQSSLSTWSKADDAQGALSGKKDGRFGFHTNEEDKPWWQVDLGRSETLHEVRVYNRIYGSRQRSRTLQILLSTNGATWKLVHDQAGRPFGGVDGFPLRAMLNNEKARYVRLQLNERNYLHLDAVEVY